MKTHFKCLLILVGVFLATVPGFCQLSGPDFGGVALSFLDAPDEGAKTSSSDLRLSWSSTSLQDTLKVGESGWVHCYAWCIWGDDIELDLMQVGGMLCRSPGVEAVAMRSILPGSQAEITLDPDLECQFTTLYFLDCPAVDEAAAVAEYDVYIDVDLLCDVNCIYYFPVNGGTRLVYDIYGDCLIGYSLAVQGNAIFVEKRIVAADSLPFGSLKAMYR